MRRVDVSIHAPWEGCDVARPISLVITMVSIHAPWEGCDRYASLQCYRACVFQFTHPGKGATNDELHGEFRTGVSIHAPWEGCDSVVQRCVL